VQGITVTADLGEALDIGGGNGAAEFSDVTHSRRAIGPG
jgi:hypothetical protein